MIKTHLSPKLYFCRWVKISLFLTSCLLIQSCGGGSGDSSTDTEDNSTPAIVDSDDDTEIVSDQESTDLPLSIDFDGDGIANDDDNW